jgi:2-polyprenyl-3-methyl-5-hydroxy-6-metoxy-1,4-benzoquinol methylase
VPRRKIEFDPSRELRELREYLGADYDQSKLEQYARNLAEEFAEVRDEASFYRNSEAYLYDLTAFAMSGTKLPYLERLLQFVDPPASILDFGCGIGSDGLLLLEAGFKVEFADFDNPSTRYLHWRMAKRGLAAPIHDLDLGIPSGPFAAAFAFDVIEHVDEPFAFLRQLEGLASLVAVNFLDEEPDESIPLHRRLPVRTLLDDAADGRIIHYGIYHDRSHLVIYRPPRGHRADRLISKTRLLGGRVGARLLAG